MGESKPEGERIMFELGNMRDGSKDFVYLKISKEELPQFVRDLIDGAAKCMAATDAPGYTALLPGTLYAVDPKMEAIIQGYIARDKGEN